MKEWVRRQVDQLCNHLQDTLGTAQLSDDTPQPLLYGQTADSGVDTKASRSDHRHALSSAIFGAIPTAVLDISTLSSSQNTQLKILNNVFGSGTGLTLDEPGTKGSFGMIGVDFSIGGSGTNSHVALSNFNTGSAAGNRSDAVHSVARLSRIIMRCRVRATATPATSYRAYIGGYRESVGANPDTDLVDNALAFFIEADSSGVGNFRAVAKSSTTGLTTDVDLGSGWDYTGGNGNYENFRIDYDLTTASFYINDALQTQITTNIPTVKLFGWGLFAEKSAVVPSAREIWIDDIIFLGRF